MSNKRSRTLSQNFESLIDESSAYFFSVVLVILAHQEDFLFSSPSSNLYCPLSLACIMLLRFYIGVINLLLLFPYYVAFTGFLINCATTHFKILQLKLQKKFSIATFFFTSSLFLYRNNHTIFAHASASPAMFFFYFVRSSLLSSQTETFSQCHSALE